MGGASSTPYPKMFVPNKIPPRIDVGMDKAEHHHIATNLSGGDCRRGLRASWGVQLWAWPYTMIKICIEIQKQTIVKNSNHIMFTLSDQIIHKKMCPDIQQEMLQSMFCSNLCQIEDPSKRMVMVLQTTNLWLQIETRGRGTKHSHCTYFCNHNIHFVIQVHYTEYVKAYISSRNCRLYKAVSLQSFLPKKL